MMHALSRRPRVLAAMVGVVYFVIGYGSAALDPGVPDALRFLWRLGAWAASGAVFAAHLAYEHFRRGSRPWVTALHVAIAVALGGFLLAVAATVHAAAVGSNTPLGQFLLALVVWPAVTALPAFVVAFVVAAGLARLRGKVEG